MSHRVAALSDTVSRSMVDLQTSPSGSLGTVVRQHEDMQSAAIEGQSSYLFL